MKHMQAKLRTTTLGGPLADGPEKLCASTCTARRRRDPHCAHPGHEATFAVDEPEHHSDRLAATFSNEAHTGNTFGIATSTRMPSHPVSTRRLRRRSVGT